MNHVEAVHAVPIKSSRGGWEFILVSEFSEALVDTWSGWAPSLLSEYFDSSISSTFDIRWAWRVRLEGWEEKLPPTLGINLIDVNDVDMMASISIVHNCSVVFRPLLRRS